MASEPRQTAKCSKEMRLEGGSNKKCIIDVLDPRILELLELYQHVGVAILRHPDFWGWSKTNRHFTIENIQKVLDSWKKRRETLLSIEFSSRISQLGQLEMKNLTDVL